MFVLASSAAPRHVAPDAHTAVYATWPITHSAAPRCDAVQCCAASQCCPCCHPNVTLHSAVLPIAVRHSAGPSQCCPSHCCPSQCWSVTVLSVTVLSVTVLSVTVLSVTVLTVIVLSVTVLSVTVMSVTVLTVTVLSVTTGTVPLNVTPLSFGGRCKEPFFLKGRCAQRAMIEQVRAENTTNFNVFSGRLYGYNRPSLVLPENPPHRAVLLCVAVLWFSCYAHCAVLTVLCSLCCAHLVLQCSQHCAVL